MTTRVVDSESDREALIRLVRARPLPFTVEIVKGKRRSTEQNRLQRLWCKEIAEQLGDRSPEDVRAYCKLHFGVPILRAESELFALRYDEVIKPLPYETKLSLMAEPFDFSVTRLMTHEQKARYLDAISAHFIAQGVALTDPDELRRAA